MILDPKNKLYELNPVAIPVFTEFLNRIQNELFFDVKINQVYDSLTDSMVFHQKDNRNPLYNFHMFGLAIDLNLILDKRTYIKADPIDDWIRTKVPALAKELNIRWGGLFNGYPDCVHFDLANRIYTNPYKAIDKLKNHALNEFGNDLSNVQLNRLNLNSLFS